MGSDGAFDGIVGGVALSSPTLKENPECCAVCKKPMNAVPWVCDDCSPVHNESRFMGVPMSHFTNEERNQIYKGIARGNEFPQSLVDAAHEYANDD